MRARRDATTDGSPSRRGPAQIGPGVLVGIGVGAFLMVFVLGVWLLKPGQAIQSDAAGATSPTSARGAPATPVSTVTPGSAAPSSASFAGDDPVDSEPSTRPPREAGHTAAKFASAWRLPGTRAERRAALEPVASPYLAHSLVRVADPLPEGRQQNPELLSGSATGARYRVAFSTGEAIDVSVNLVGQRWVATRVDPASSQTELDSSLDTEVATTTPDSMSP